MAQDNLLGITNSLFGVAPTPQTDFNYALQNLRGLTSADIGQAQLYSAGAQLGRGLMGAAGVEDPEMASANRAKQIAAQLQQQGVSMQSSQGMKMLAQKLSEAGDFKAAQAAAALAANFEQQEATVGLKQAQTLQKQQDIMNEAQLRQELQALGPNASEDQLMAVLQKYGSPDKVIAALQSSQNKQAQLAQQRELAQERIGIQRENLAMRQDIAAEKKAGIEEKKSAAADTAIAAADRVINEVKDAKKLVSGFTAGAGGLLASVPLTNAKDLAARLATIKANLGFDRLQQMRDASPTGGALGQVAVQELIALQSTIASLDQTQSPKQLKEALDKIEASYARWRETVKKAGRSSESTSGVIKLD
jgi:hypothetical protein